MLELLQSEKTNHKNEKNNFETKLLEMKEQKIEWQKKHIKLESMLMKEIK